MCVLTINTIPVIAALVFGAVVRSGGQDYTVEAPKNNEFPEGENPKDYDGKHPRLPESLEALEAYSDVLRDYCNIGDPVCAQGSPGGDIKYHLDYFDKYSGEAAAWVVEQATGKKPKGSPTSASDAAKASASGTTNGDSEGKPSPSTTQPHSAAAQTQSAGVEPKETDPASKASALSASFGLSVFVVALSAAFYGL